MDISEGLETEFVFLVCAGEGSFLAKARIATTSLASLSKMQRMSHFPKKYLKLNGIDQPLNTYRVFIDFQKHIPYFFHMHALLKLFATQALSQYLQLRISILSSLESILLQYSLQCKESLMLSCWKLGYLCASSYNRKMPFSIPPFLSQILKMCHLSGRMRARGHQEECGVLLPWKSPQVH